MGINGQIAPMPESEEAYAERMRFRWEYANCDCDWPVWLYGRTGHHPECALHRLVPPGVHCSTDDGTTLHAETRWER